MRFRWELDEHLASPRNFSGHELFLYECKAQKDSQELLQLRKQKIKNADDSLRIARLTLPSQRITMLLIDVFSELKFCCPEDKNESLAAISRYIHGRSETGNPEGHLLSIFANACGRTLYYNRSPEEKSGYDYLSLCISTAKETVDKLLIAAINNVG